jgi:DHA3 family tetracycline resistance protein-like MFS transporter
LEFSASLLFSLIFTVNMLYQVTVVDLSPLHLVLVGTILEGTVFLFEMPTGVVADLKSRRLSVIVGYALIGMGFLVEASFPVFWVVALAQVIWGFGYTFTSGATQAWIADEVGEEQAGAAFLRGEQAARAGALLAIPLSVALGAVNVRLPILLGGLMMVMLAIFLAVTMTEEGYTPTPPEDRATWRQVLKTAQDARQLVRRQPVLLTLLGVALVYGLYSEGFDRLWTPHLLESFDLVWLEAVKPVAWIGVIRAISLLISLAATEVARRRVDTNRPEHLALVLMLNAALIVVALAGFGLAKSFWVALVLFWIVGAARTVTSPLQTVWFNLCIDDPRVRATAFSLTGQADAIGQIAGGPGVGLIGNRSIRMALLASSLILSPVLPLYGLAVRQTRQSPRAGGMEPGSGGADQGQICA